MSNIFRFFTFPVPPSPNPLQERKKEHAKALRVRGARVVVDDMKLLLPLVDTFNECMAKGVDFCLPIAQTIDTLPRETVWE